MPAEKIKMTVSIPHVQKEYNVEVPRTVTGGKLFEAMFNRAKDHFQDGSLNGTVVYELIAKHSKKKIYPDLEHQTLEQMGLKDGETIILKIDMNAGGVEPEMGNCSGSTLKVLANSKV